jgi:exopolysaccharide biosynthesis polyprenyl glycosylphosphotransferase
MSNSYSSSLSLIAAVSSAQVTRRSTQNTRPKERKTVTEGKRRFLLNARKLFDVGLVILSFGLATFLVVSADEGSSLSRFLSMRVKLSNCAIFAITLFFCHGMFSLCGLYESKRLSTRLSESLDAMKAITLSTACVALVSELFSVVMVTPRFLASFWVIGSILVIASRLFLQYCLAWVRRHGRNLRFVLVLGTNSRAIEFARKIEAAPERGYQLLGFVDEEWPGLEEFETTGFKLACDYEGLPGFLRRNVVDEVAIYLPLRSFYQHSSQVAALCEQHGIVMRFASDIFGLKIARSRAEEFNGDQHITAYTDVRDEWPLMIKRALDLVISLILIVLLAPLFVVVAILIKLSSQGPVFFRQERIGLNKRRFFIYKFRTMVPNAEELMAALEGQNEVSGPVFKMKNDPRITPIGNLARRTSIDELPQLFNIVKGDMSLVGPRPLPVRDYEGFNEDWQRRRFSVRPGITCLWQVNGRSSIPFEQWMRLDLQYMDEWSLWLDLKILARTIPAVLKGSGAA